MMQTKPPATCRHCDRFVTTVPEYVDRPATYHAEARCAVPDEPVRGA